jgi:hypothetical protein
MDITKSDELPVFLQAIEDVVNGINNPQLVLSQKQFSSSPHKCAITGKAYGAFITYTKPNSGTIPTLSINPAVYEFWIGLWLPNKDPIIYLWFPVGTQAQLNQIFTPTASLQFWDYDPQKQTTSKGVL